MGGILVRIVCCRAGMQYLRYRILVYLSCRYEVVATLRVILMYSKDYGIWVQNSVPRFQATASWPETWAPIRVVSPTVANLRPTEAACSISLVLVLCPHMSSLVISNP
jgi:hypothetical protein